MGKKLTSYVHVQNPEGTYEVFGPEDDLPDWAEKAIAPGAFEQPEPFPQPGSSQPSDDVPPEARPGAQSGSLEDLSKEELVELAKANDVPSSGNKDEIIDRLRESGVEPA